MAGREFNICEWPASLYDNKTRRWNYGTLIVMAEEIVFLGSDSGKSGERFSILYEDLIEVKKSTTGLIFGAIVIITKQNEKIWFSSLPDREYAYGALKHFWKARLYQKSGRGKTNAQGQRTKMGQKLLGIVKNSEETLSKAAVQLYEQGKQIDHTIDAMDDLHSDLDIANNLVEDIDSWIGRWRVPAQYKTVDPVVVNKCDIPDVFEDEVLFTKLETSRANTRQVGNVRISDDGLTILNTKMKTEFHFRWSDVSKVRVVSPWEIMVIRYQIGKPDLIYNLVSANMMAIIKLLESCAKYKLSYDTPPEPVLCTRHKDTKKKDFLSNDAEDRGKGKSGGAEALNPVKPVKIMGVDQIKIDQSQQVVSESEADEISRKLGGLKSLALAVQEETTVQNENLDVLTETVDRANQRLKNADKKIKRMT